MAIPGLSRVIVHPLQWIGALFELRKINQELNLIVTRPALLSIEEVEEYVKQYSLKRFIENHRLELVEQELSPGSQPGEDETYSADTVLKITGKDPNSKQGDTHIFFYFYNANGLLEQKIYLHVADGKTIWIENVEIRRVGNTVIRFEIAYNKGELFRSALNVKEMGSERHYYRPENSTDWHRMLKEKPPGKDELVNKEDLGDLDATDIAPLKLCVAVFQRPNPCLVTMIKLGLLSRRILCQ